MRLLRNSHIFLSLISTANNVFYLRIDVTDDEIQVVIFQMKPFEVLGPDGVPGAFYQHFQDTIKDDVVRIVKSFFSRWYILKELNCTHIALIPKNNCLFNLKGFRPINLCNVCYKIIAKILANNFKIVMDCLINSYQSAFIKGKPINDNIFFAAEMISFIHKAIKHKTKWCVTSRVLYGVVSW